MARLLYGNTPADFTLGPSGVTYPVLAPEIRSTFPSPTCSSD